MDILRFRNFPRFRNSKDSRNSWLSRFRNSSVSRFRNSGVSPIQKLQVAPIQKPLHAISVLNANPSLSKSSCHDCKSFLKLNHHFQKFSPPKPYMQWYSSMHIPPFDRVLVTMASHFLNFPPQSPTCNGIPQCKSLPLIESLSRLQVIF